MIIFEVKTARWAKKEDERTEEKNLKDSSIKMNKSE
jgi:hypothetical protein